MIDNKFILISASTSTNRGRATYFESSGSTFFDRIFQWPHIEKFDQILASTFWHFKCRVSRWNGEDLEYSWKSTSRTRCAIHFPRRFPCL